MKTELLAYLRSLEQKGVSLSVKWDAGGDETILTFYENGKRVTEAYEGLYGKLRDFLIQQFDLPNAGEYYNEGEGTFGREGEQVTFLFSELAYSLYESDGFESIHLEDDLTAPPLSAAKDFLAAMAWEEAYLYGSIFYFRGKIENETFGLMGPEASRPPSHPYAGALKEESSRIARSRIKQAFQQGEIRYSAKFTATETCFEEISLLKYATDKDHRGKKVILFA
jgi:hypothetical protein